MESESPLDELFRALSSKATAGKNSLGTVAVLMTETLKYRDRLKEETGYVLTVEDTRQALTALELHLNGRALPTTLTPEQTALVELFIQRLTSST